LILRPHSHKTITDYLRSFVSYDNRGFNKAAGRDNKIARRGPNRSLKKMGWESVCLYTKHNEKYIDELNKKFKKKKTY